MRLPVPGNGIALLLVLFHLQARPIFGPTFTAVYVTVPNQKLEEIGIFENGQLQYQTVSGQTISLPVDAKTMALINYIKSLKKRTLYQVPRAIGGYSAGTLYDDKTTTIRLTYNESSKTFTVYASFTTREWDLFHFGQHHKWVQIDAPGTVKVFDPVIAMKQRAVVDFGLDGTIAVLPRGDLNKGQATVVSTYELEHPPVDDAGKAKIRSFKFPLGAVVFDPPESAYTVAEATPPGSLGSTVRTSGRRGIETILMEYGPDANVQGHVIVSDDPTSERFQKRAEKFRCEERMRLLR